jgi:hypothetical protein
LSIGPLDSQAQTPTRLYNRLVELTPTALPDLRAAWEATVKTNLATFTTPPVGLRSPVSC